MACACPVNDGPGCAVKTAMNRAGARAEDLCERFLVQSGLRVLARNWRCRMGEIDLIAQDSGTLVFAEARYRGSASRGGAAESITAAKRPRLIAAAQAYLRGRPESDCRFDVLLLDALERDRIEWIRNEFGT